jgi:hypothetical protein
MKINSYAQFKMSVGGFPRCGSFLYRGIGRQFTLLPSISYSGEKNVGILQDRALQAQRKFNESFLQLNPDSALTDYQLIFLSRHCGLISPFMDFTFDDTVAIQFGMEMADNNPVHLYVIDIRDQQINCNENGLPESTGFRIYRPNLVWNANGFLTQERTQFIQKARLVAQQANTLATPFNETFGDRIMCYEIFPEDFNRFREEIAAEGINMDADLLINNKDQLFRLAREINNEITQT